MLYDVHQTTQLFKKMICSAKTADGSLNPLAHIGIWPE